MFYAFLPVTPFPVSPTPQCLLGVASSLQLAFFCCWESRSCQSLSSDHLQIHFSAFRCSHPRSAAPSGCRLHSHIRRVASLHSPLTAEACRPVPAPPASWDSFSHLMPSVPCEAPSLVLSCSLSPGHPAKKRFRAHISDAFLIVAARNAFFQTC